MKKILITGANSGIGKTTAIALAKQGNEIIMVCRNAAKAEEAKKEIIAKSGNDKVSLMICDLGSLLDIRRFGNEFRGRYNSLDILINNAGAIFSEREVNADGFEKTFATNHLNYFAFTHELLPVLRNATKARIVCVASEAHRFAKFDINDLNAEKGYSMWYAYGNSKLCNILFTRHLSKLLHGENITVNCLHPGVVRTNFGTSDISLLKLFGKIAGMIMISPEKGAETTVYLATSPAVEGISGVYFSKCRSKKTTEQARDEKLAETLWNKSLEMTGIKNYGKVS